ncbi:MAG: Acyl carrier protein [Candidatus Magasanikbacteria bacterium GW2011_GWC2_45_8]|uniref:Acyl carrier protein n=1 Tax=Candidatus Magasanikbacteria bacterium GW2011_GWC2_45_8 TaxID=1619050 RepID=A0A0G1QYW8_9BACT|nr:MAG: Acyl carrier protein [Candidatus Magasanikbacteria bacterium GW2011_GWC2_45_8]
MNKKIEEKLAKIIKEIFGVKITDSLSMDSVEGWDSLRHIQLMAKIEKEFDIEIDFQDTLAMTNIKSIKEIIEKYTDKK